MSIDFSHSEEPGFAHPVPGFFAASHEEMARIVEALYHVHRLIAVLTDLDSLLERITEESKKVARAEASSLVLYDEANDELFFHVALGESGDQETLKREIRLKMGQGIAGAAAQSRKAIIVNNAQEDPRFFRGADNATQFQTRSLVAVPMVDRVKLVGVLEVVNKAGGGEFTDMDLRILEMFSALAATSIVNARLIKDQISNARMAAVGQAVTGLSHYTKNIVTGLSSSSDLIEMGLKTENFDVIQRSWPVFKRSTKRISNFVQDMLSFSKPRKPMRERFDVADLIREAYDTFAELLVHRQVDVRIDTEQVTEPAFVDGQSIYRVLLNLLTNAADAAPEEGGRIEVVARTAPDGTLEIRVADNGSGIPEEHLERIFDPFFSTKGPKGTGIGLAVSRKIAVEHGGEITVVNLPGGGAEFLVSIPSEMNGEETQTEL